MESFRDDKLGFYARYTNLKVLKYGSEGKIFVYHLDIKIIKELSKRMHLKIIKRNHYVRTQGIFVTL